MSSDLGNINMSVTNFEAREVYREAMSANLPQATRGLSIPFDPSITILYICGITDFMPDLVFSGHYDVDPIMVRTKSLKTMPGLCQIDHLAVGLEDVMDCSRHLFCLIAKFPKLRSFTWITDTKSLKTSYAQDIVGDAASLAISKDLTDTSKTMKRNIARKKNPGAGKVEIRYMDEYGFQTTEELLGLIGKKT